jgi:membrane protease subunit (stomatin/prohibitin family)
MARSGSESLAPNLGYDGSAAARFTGPIAVLQEDGMAFLDKLKGEFVDIIEWNEDGSDTVVWRFPRYQDEIKNGAQLTVRPGQAAVFVNEGKVADVFQPGLHTLDTRNLPILSTLKGWKYGFDSPFKAEVYFVSTRQFTDLKWGTKNPVMLRDPEFGPMRLRAFGSYVAKVRDARKLVEQLAGTSAAFTVDDIREQLRNVIASRFADVLASAQIPALGLAASYDVLSARLAQIIEPDFARFGFAATQLLIENIALPEEAERALDKRTSMGVVGNLDQFARFQAAQAMEAAAKNPGGAAGSVLGLGVGLGLAGQFAGAAQAAPPLPARPGGPPPLPGKEWWIALDGQQSGPHDLAALAALAASGRVDSATLAWKDGQEGWLPVGAIAELRAVLGARAE